MPIWSFDFYDTCLQNTLIEDYHSLLPSPFLKIVCQSLINCNQDSSVKLNQVHGNTIS